MSRGKYHRSIEYNSYALVCYSNQFAICPVRDEGRFETLGTRALMLSGNRGTVMLCQATMRDSISQILPESELSEGWTILNCFRREIKTFLFDLRDLHR